MAAPPLVRTASRSTLAAIGLVAGVGVLAASVRLLPWLMAKTVPLRVATPFARGLLSLALEVAMVIGLPLGWSMAAYRFWERGEARVLGLLGESPRTTLARLLPLSGAFVVVLVLLSALGGRETTDPGRVATRLLEEARAACGDVKRPTTMSVPFTDLTWLCRPDAEPRLVGEPPAFGSAVVMTAKDAHIAGDFRRIELEDAHISWASSPAPTDIAVKRFTVRGLSPWAHASSLPIAVRVIVLALIALASGSLAVVGIFHGRLRTRLRAVVSGAVGPLAGLALLRVLEREDAMLIAYALPALGAAAATWGTILAFSVSRRRTATREAGAGWRSLPPR